VVKFVQQQVMCGTHGGTISCWDTTAGKSKLIESLKRISCLQTDWAPDPVHCNREGTRLRKPNCVGGCRYQCQTLGHTNEAVHQHLQRPWLGHNVC
jgi:hypothetical protein